MKNKIFLALIITACIVAVAGIIHTVIGYVSLAGNNYSGVPASMALLILIPYLLVSIICLIIGLIVRRKNIGK